MSVLSRARLLVLAMSLMPFQLLASDRGAAQRIGACVGTRIVEITGVYQATAPDKDGAVVGYANGVAGVSFKREPEIERSKVGDSIRLCLVEIDKGCKRGDPRGRIYRATNLRTGGSWELGNSMHACGGA